MPGQTSTEVKASLDSLTVNVGKFEPSQFENSVAIQAQIRTIKAAIRDSSELQASADDLAAALAVLGAQEAEFKKKLRSDRLVSDVKAPAEVKKPEEKKEIDGRLHPSIIAITRLTAELIAQLRSSKDYPTTQAEEKDIKRQKTLGLHDFLVSQHAILTGQKDPASLRDASSRIVARLNMDSIDKTISGSRGIFAKAEDPAHLPIKSILENYKAKGGRGEVLQGFLADFEKVFPKTATP